MPRFTKQFSFAVSQHRAGRRARAERIYRRILTSDPNHAGALHLLGVLASEEGNHELAACLITRAIAEDGPRAAYCSHLGDALAKQGKTLQAIACYVQALETGPPDAATLGRLGRALSVTGDAEAARDCFGGALQMEPNHAQSHFDLGNIHHAAGRWEESAACYQKAATLRPDYAEAFYNLGVTRTLQDRADDAVEAYRQALHTRPDYPDAHANLGSLLHAMQQPEAAAAHYQRAIGSGSREALHNGALLAQQQDRLEDARIGYESLLAKYGDDVETRNNLGNTLLGLGRPGDAVACYRMAIAARPEYPEAHWNLAFAELLRGNFEAGWQEYGWRFQQPGKPPRQMAQPMWDGSPLAGKRILLHAEQGLGDTLQFARYAALVSERVSEQVDERGGAVILECQPALVRLLADLAGVETIVSRGSELPAFDCHAPLLSLPSIFGSSASSLPAAVPYVRAEPKLVRQWGERIAAQAPAPDILKVGLAWEGNPRHENDLRRSLHQGELAALAGVPGAVFFGLQRSAASPPGLDMIPLLDESSGFEDTAAILLNLDLLISVDTSVAHLAGALARPVWTLLPFAPDWRWRLSGQTTPWYPTMRLYRQPRRNDWAGALSAVRADLIRSLALGP